MASLPSHYEIEKAPHAIGFENFQSVMTIVITHIFVESHENAQSDRHSISSSLFHGHLLPRIHFWRRLRGKNRESIPTLCESFKAVVLASCTLFHSAT